jgi:enoyl-CoA hydratase
MTDSVLVQDDVVGVDALARDVVVRTLTLSAPAKKNALTHSMLAALKRALPTTPAGTHQPVRAVVLQGAAGSFSSGFDLSALDDDERARGIDPIGSAADALERCLVPVVAAVDGCCMGGAVELASACALRIAASSTSFCVPATRLGLVYPTSGLARLQAILGPHSARVMAFAMPFAAVQAQMWGLIHEVVDDARSEAAKRAREIAGCAPLAVSGTLAALKALQRGDRDGAERLRVPSLRSTDLAVGIEAARKKMPPIFGGH